MKRVAFGLLAASILASAGCTIPTSGTSPSVGTSPAGSQPGTPPASAGSSDAVAAATALVRAGAVMATPVASAPITGDGHKELNGGTLHVFSVRSTDSSTRLEWAITHPTFTTTAMAINDGRLGVNAPYLVAGGKECHPTQFEGKRPPADEAWLTTSARQLHMITTPRPIYATYAPLPADVTEVEVKSPLISAPIAVKVDRGVEPAPTGTTDVPILGRSVLGNMVDSTITDPLIVTLHGLRRMQGGTILYYSTTFPAGATPPRVQ